MSETFWAIVSVFVLSFVQNVSFTMVSRSRNRNHRIYHACCSLFSNAIWFATFRQLVLQHMDWVLFAPYAAGTMTGSVSGMDISMWFEKKLGAASDNHLKDKKA